MALPMLYAEPKIKEPLYFSRNLVLHFKRNCSRLREQRYAVCTTVSCYEVLHHVDLGSISFECSRLAHVKGFTDATFRLMTGHLQGQDMTIPIMKDLAQRPKLKAPPSLINLQDTFKEFLFDYHRNMVPDRMHHNTYIKIDENRNRMLEPALHKTITRDTPSTKRPAVLFTDPSAAKIQLELASIMKHIKMRKKLVAEAATVEKKSIFHQQKTQAQYERYVEVNAEHFKAWQTNGHVDVHKMREDLDRLGQKYFNSQDQHEKIKIQHTMILDECEDMITLLKSKLQQLQQWIERDIVLALEHCVRQLKEIGQSFIMTKSLAERIDNIDVRLIAREIYHQLCVPYEFADITRDGIKTGDDHMMDLTSINDLMCEKTGHGDNALLDTRDTDINLEGIYVKAIHNSSKELKGDIQMKRGQIAKVKLWSCDGETGFGWTKNTFGKKKLGFLRTSHFDTKPLSTTRMYKGPQKTTEGCASAATDVN